MFGTELRFVRAEGRGASGLAVRGVGMRCGIHMWVGIEWSWDAVRNTNTNASYSKGRAALQTHDRYGRYFWRLHTRLRIERAICIERARGNICVSKYCNVQDLYEERHVAMCMPDAGCRKPDAGCRMHDVLKVWLCVGVLWRGDEGAYVAISPVGVHSAFLQGG